ncbi:MAG: 50S ribosomal protein L3 [Candidatus Beckwithbacteria bacterium GW2011_GWA2_43_10]|uniref:Large ribosomal subunit protein uL3 n=1 Tax=Candidatus Beckwithbacteria bacterium GW2011_GWA2_43_10 TaxID=1618369 RepID=A0A0G1C4W4_9BACT|nr:MAG: 50S ribosomal protein L3 [Candidatus Beckwithbacteria bacterium GW2011_GWA2_43_10]
MIDQFFVTKLVTSQTFDDKGKRLVVTHLQIDPLTVNRIKLQPGELIKATGLSKGRGFSGVMKRHGFHGGPKTHGQSDRSRSPGSIGMRTTPGRVWKGKKMAGHYGMATKTIRNLKVINFDETTNILTISGTVPGHRHSLLKIHKLPKKPNA